MKDGIPLNDDSGLEHEADVMGARALTAAGSGTGRDPEAPPLKNPAAPALATGSADAAVQRKVGFEFETGNKFYWQDKLGKWNKVGRTKGDPMYVGENFSIEGDTKSTPEIILEPMDDWDKIEAAINAAGDVLDSVNATEPDNEKRRVMPASQQWKHATAFDKDIDENWTADIQVTHGVALSNISAYLDHHLGRNVGAKTDALRERQARMAKVTKTNNPLVDGFVDLVVQFVADMSKWVGKDNDEGPKNAQAFMARNPYSKMLGSMEGKDQAVFAALFLDGNKKWKADNPVTKATGVKAADPVIKNKYQDGNGKQVENKTSLEQWIVGMIGNVAKADAMSPPQGWGGKNSDYGMGLLDVDTRRAHR
jgi:hypothetical protein